MSLSQFDIGPGGAEALLNSVAYKACYYKFGQMPTEYGRPTGFDRARNREVGRKNIELTTLDEAFTSEHWIVRIYKVKKQPNLPSIKKAGSKKALKKLYRKKSTSSSSSSSKGAFSRIAAAADDDTEDISMYEEQDQAKYIGCFSSENFFSSDKIYNGGSTGANYNIALHHAKATNMKYFAVAKAGSDGHAFAFSSLINFNAADKNMKGGDMRGPDCERRCEDVHEKFCGCIDYACASPLPPGEEHNRRWIVYQVVDHNHDDSSS